MRITIELIVCVFISRLNFYMIYLFGLDGQSVFEYCMEIFTFGKCMLVMFDGIRHAKEYKLYFESIQVIRRHCLNEAQYTKLRKSLIIKCCTSVTAFIVPFVAFIVSNALGNDFSDSEIIFFWPIVFKISFYAWIDLRYIFEHLVAYCIIIEIYDVMKILNDSVREDLELYSVNADNFICMNDVEEDESYETLEKVNIWREYYENILKCSKHISQCFGELVTTSSEPETDILDMFIRKSI